MNKFVLRIFAILVSAILCCTAMVSCSNFGNEYETLLKEMSAQEYIEAMGLGINLGNTLDSCGSWIANYGDGSTASYETAWGNPVTTREMIAFMKSEGFDTIRIPVTWDEHIGEAPDYKVDKEWMDRVEEVVDWALKEDFFVILNIHHDETWVNKASTDYDTVMARYLALWKQIIDRFGDKSYRLVFESNNEVGFEGLNDEEGCSLMQVFNDAFVELVRSYGDKNEDRMLLLAAYCTNISKNAKYPPTFTDERCAISFHCYGPTTFTIADPGTSWGFRDTWGTESDYREMQKEFDVMKTLFVDQGIPVIIGEFGASTNGKDQTSRELWMNEVVRLSFENNMCPILWDAGGTIDRENLDWKIEGDREALMSSVPDKYFESEDR